MSATRRHVDLEINDMEESGPAPLARRLSDHKHRFFRFDPTVSSGTLLQLGSIAIGFAVAYGTYQADRTQMKADIEAGKVAAEYDRTAVKISTERLASDVKEMKVDLKDVSNRLIEIKAQTTGLNQGNRK